MQRSLPILLLLIAGVTAGCSLIGPPAQLRGNKVDAEQLKDMIPGTSTRADATSLLGSPTAKAAFDDNTWIYISERTQSRVGRTPGIQSQDVVALTFDDRGVLRAVKHLTQDDAKPVSVVSRATPSPGSEATFMQQLLGNVGRFSAGPSGSGSSGSGGSGATFGAK